MRHSYKRIFAMVLAVTVMTGLTACGGASSAGVSSSAKVENSASDASGDGTFTASGKTLNVGVQSNIISIPTVYAKEKGYFDELGLDVNLIMFPNGSPENEGLAAEQLDLASNGLASVYSTASGLCDWIPLRQRFMYVREVLCYSIKERFQENRICTAAQIPSRD